MLKTLEGHRAAFLAGLPVRIATRRDRLARAIALIDENRAELCDSLIADACHRDRDEAMQQEILPALDALRDALGNMDGWIAPALGTGLLDRLPRAKDEIEYRPLGVVGLAVPARQPLKRSVSRLAGALAAGNCVVAKIDGATPSLGRLLEGLAPHYFDRHELSVLGSGPDADAAFAGLPFDTASPAAVGKSVAIIGRSADPARAAEQLIASKLPQSGRPPFAPDYLLVPSEREEEIAGWLWRAAMHLYPRLPRAGAAPLSSAERERASRLIADARARGAEILVADHRDVGAGSMPLHIVRFASHDMLVMQEEIRGPILPLLGYDRIDTAIGEIQRRDPPLALYHFGSDAAERRQLLDRTTSSVVALDAGATGVAAAFEAAPPVPAARGPVEESFRSFSRLRRICRQPGPNARPQDGKAAAGRPSIAAQAAT